MNGQDLADIHLRILAGDPEGPVALQEAMRGRVVGWLVKKGLPCEDAEEVWNDALLACLNRVATIEPLGTGLRAFILDVAQKRYVDAVRRSLARPVSALDPDAPIPAERPTELDPAVAELVQASLKEARPAYREIMEMTARGLTASEIAEVLGKTEASVAKQRSRARAWFAKRLEGALHE